MKDGYTTAKNAPYEAWSDSYAERWLISQGLIRSHGEKQRDEVVRSRCRHATSSGVLTPFAQLSMVKDNYYGAQDTVYDSWKDSDLRSYLISAWLRARVTACGAATDALHSFQRTT